MRRPFPGAASLAALLLAYACAVGPAHAQSPPVVAPPARGPEAGLPFITAFAPTDYDAGEGNWAVAEDARGVVYVGNVEGVLEYDGATWRRIPLPNRSMARSLARDGRGRIWVGGVGELGYLAADGLGRTSFVSLRAEVPEPYRDFADVWQVHATDDGVYFTTYGALFRWDGREMRVWRPASEFHTSFLVHGAFYVREWGRGLLRMEPAAAGGTSADVLRLVPGGERLAQTRVYAMLPFDRRRILVGTREEGLLLYDGATFEPFATEADGVLAESGLYTAAALPGGAFALGTRWRGLLVIDRRGRLVLRLDRDGGLPDNTVLSTHQDGEGNLWLGLSSGVARVELGAPATRYGRERGVTSTSMALARHEGRLYAANAHGGPTYLDAGAGTFRPILDAPSHSTDLLAVAGGLLLAGSNDGVHRIRGDRIEPVRPAASYDYAGLALHPWSRDPRTVLVGLSDGLAVLRRGDAGAGRAGWVDAGRVPGVGVDVREIAEAPDGALWLGGQSGRLARVRLPEPGAAGGLDPRRTEVTLFGPEHGLPGGPLVPYRVGGRLYYSARGERLLRYDEAAGRFVDDGTFDGAKSGHPLARLALREDAEGRVWISSTYGPPVVAHPRARAGGGYAFEPLLRFRRSRIHDVYPEADGVVWLMGAAEVVRYETRRPAAPGGGGPPLVRRVATADRLLYGGAGGVTAAEVPHGAGALRFAYASPGGAGPARYRTRLDGFDEGWTAWSAEAERTYTNLPPGRYRFLVEAEGRAEAASFALTVLPPWYRTWWAYALFGVTAVLVLFGAHRTRTRQLHRRQLALEREVGERTQALRAEKQKTEEQAERLREMDQVKSRFFVNVSHEFRTPLTLTIGPLEDLQAELQRGDLEQERRHPLLAGARRHVDLALRNSRRLLRLINQLLDVAKLETGEMRLDARLEDLTAFVRGIARSFTPLAERRHVRFSVKALEGPVPVPFDAEKLEQVLVNLLSNAFKFTPEGGVITVTVAREGTGGVSGAAVVTVRDSGAGISPEALPHVFERFYQAEETHSEVQPGTGIGLSLAKDLTELHGGTIFVESEVGFGAAFTVRLPLGAAPSLGDGAPAPDAPRPRIAFEIGEGTPEASGSDAGAPDEDDRTTVLIADDNAEIRAYVRQHLEPRYRVLEAADGAAALETARASLPDLVVSDVMMPVLDGFALVRALREDPHTDFIPVVLLTARATEKDKVDGLVEGAEAYLTKPFNVRELLAQIENLIASRQRLRARFAASPSAPAARPDSKQGGGDGLPASDVAFLAHVRAAVEGGLGEEDFGVEELAAAVEKSRSTLHRRLRHLLQQSPTAFIRQVRLEHAAALLHERRGTISEVAYAVGFRSVSHFSQAFRAQYGVAPSVFVMDELRAAEGAPGD